MVFLGLDLKRFSSICDPARDSFAGGIDELGKAGIRTSYAAFAADNVSEVCGALWRRAQGQELFLSRSISLHGVRPTDISGKPARHRSVSASARKQAVPLGHSESSVAQHAGRCQRSARLAHLRRLCAISDPYCPAFVCGRTVWGGSERDGLRPGCQRHRLVPVGVFLGAVSLGESGHQAAYAFGPARQYPFVPAYQRRQTARRECSGPVAARARSLLHHGPGLYRLRAALSPSPGGQLLRDASPRPISRPSAAILIPSTGTPD